MLHNLVPPRRITAPLRRLRPPSAGTNMRRSLQTGGELPDFGMRKRLPKHCLFYMERRVWVKWDALFYEKRQWKRADHLDLCNLRVAKYKNR